MAVLSAVVSCSDLTELEGLPETGSDVEELLPSEEGCVVDVRSAVPGNVQGTLPQSGTPVTAVLNGGLAPLSFPKAIQSTVVGVVKGNGEYPDLLVQCSSGESEAPMYYCTYKSKDLSGRLVYEAPVAVSTIPWSREDLAVRVCAVGSRIYGFHLSAGSGKIMSVYEFNASSRTFASVASVTVSGIDYGVAGFEVIPQENGNIEVLVLCDDGSVYYPTLADRTHSSYNSAGIWMGELSNSKLFRFTLNGVDWSAGEASLLSGTSRPMLNGGGVAAYDDAENDRHGYLVAGRLGAVSYLASGKETQPAYPLYSDGNEFSNRTYTNSIVTFNGTGVFLSGEGAIYYSDFAGRYTKDGAPVFNGQKPVMMENGSLFCGTMSVPDVVDWDGDGILDIISGNSDGRIAFFRNEGTDELPAFGEPVYLKSNGYEVRVRSGYYELGGPFDSAWGFSCPTVCDWNGDGVPDIVVSSNASKIMLYLGNGRDGADCLQTGRVITCDGMDVWGMWQTRPAVMRSGSDLYMMFTDEDDALHLYRKRAYGTVADCGQVKLKDESKITCHRSTSLMTTLIEQGKIKLELCDWDGDGDHDLIVGTTSVSALPNTSGYPYAAGTDNMQMLIFENLGDDDEMVFEYPRMFKAFGGDFFMGSHAVAPVYCELGDSKRGPNMLVGTESGAFYFFARHDLREQTL